MFIGADGLPVSGETATVAQARGDLIQKLRLPDPRRALQQRRLDILLDRGWHHVEAEIQNRFRSRGAQELLRQFIDTSNNSYKAVINKLAVVYKEPARRIFSRRRDTRLWDRILGEDIDLTLETVNRIAMACNECLLRPVVRDGRLEFDIITPGICEVDASGLRLRAIAYETEGGYVLLDEFWEYRTDQKGNVEAALLHATGRVPVVVFRRNRPIGGFWLGSDGEDLVELWLMDTIWSTWTMITGFLQSHKELCEKPALTEEAGRGVATNVDTGPWVIHRGDFSVLDLRTDIEAMVKAGQARRAAVAANWGINWDVISQSKFGSGLERLMAMSGLNEKRLETIKQFRPAEGELMRLAALVWNATPGVGEWFSPQEQLDPRIDYAELRLINSAKEELDALGAGMELGVASPIDYVMAKDPDIADRVEAAKLIDRNLEESNKVLEARRKYSQPEEVAAAMGAAGGIASGKARRPRVTPDAAAGDRIEGD